MTKADTTARLFAIIARQTRKAIVFRRGPSRTVLLLTWDLESDTLTAGQWFKGRIYERRCDLSPDGELLCYFAAKHHGRPGTWTAISRPPYLKALALWEKGDGWGGGGLFDTHNSLRLNHRPGPESDLASGFTLPKTFRVAPFGDRSGWGEDDPIYTMRTERDGWATTAPGQFSDYNNKGPLAWIVDPPMVVEKPIANGRIQISLHGLHERHMRKYMQTARVTDLGGERCIDLGRVEWADADHNGDVLFARGGCLYRMPHPFAGTYPSSPRCIADLNDLSFEARIAPDHAVQWPQTN